MAIKRKYVQRKEDPQPRKEKGGKDVKGGVEVVPAGEFLQGELKTYGEMTVQNRAIPSLSDGLKPVHRRVLWAMVNLQGGGLRPPSPHKKAARVVGDTMAKFHPHGDMAIYDAMVTLATFQPIPLIDGQGNWGKYNQDPAPPRYTECRLTKFADKVLLDREYLEVMDKIRTYDNEGEEPVNLPALLPVLLLNGATGIATAVAVKMPSFKLEGVISLVDWVLKNDKQPSAAKCAQHLVFTNTWGGEVTSDEDELLAWFKTGKGQVTWKCNYTVENDKLIVTGLCPDIASDQMMIRIANMADVKSCQDEGGDRKDKRSIRIVVQAKQGLQNKDRQALFKTIIQKELTRSITYSLAVTYRSVSEDNLLPESVAEFSRATIPSIIYEWCQWRIELEKKYLRWKKDQLQAEIHRLLIFIKASDMIDALVKILKTAKDREQLQKQIAKLLKIEIEDTNLILEMPVRRLAKLEGNLLKKKVAELKEQVSAVVALQKQPSVSVTKQLKKMATALEV
jgi:DNA gyrase subunit A